MLLGSTGLLGSAFYSYMKSGNYLFVSPNRSELDLLDFDKLEKFIHDYSPTYIINCAGYNLVDKAEESIYKDLCFNLNVELPRSLACFANKYNAKLAHFSSDYVFDGNNTVGYTEDDKRNPINHYGYTKMLSEDAVLNNSPNALIQRISWLFGPYKDNFVSFICAQLNSGGPVKAICDQYGKPTYTFDVVKATLSLLQGDYFGVFHTPNSDSCSWYELAEAIRAHYGASTELVHPIEAADLNRLAVRPKYSILNSIKIPSLRSHKEALDEYLTNSF